MKKNRKNKKFSFEVGVTEHCNLNCKGCAHFSPLSNEYFMPLNIFCKDIKRLSELLNYEAKWIHIMGGEPLLHPQLNEILMFTRKCFPNAKIKLVTNGKSFKDLKDDFWRTCHNNNIIINPTKYPCDINYKEFSKIAHKYGVKYRYMNGPKLVKKMKKYPFDLDGNQDPSESFRLCKQANKFITLKDGKLYTCPTIAYVNIFNKYFNKNMVVSEQDSVNIYKISTKEQIVEKLSCPTMFCRYCDIRNIEKGLKWETSNKKIFEWI